LDQGAMERAIDWCRENSIECAYLLVDAGDVDTLRACAAHEFRLVDVRVTLEAAVLAAPREPSGAIRLAREGHIPPLPAMAAVCHTDSRFYADERFDRARCDELYATWIEKSCRGWADAVFVAERDGAPAGYISCHVRDGGRGEIGLVGIAERARGRGLGSA